MLHISAMYSREDIVKLLLSKRGVDPFATGGVSYTLILTLWNLFNSKHQQKTLRQLKSRRD